MTDTHTPGPWKVCGHDRGGCDCRQVWSPGADVMVAVAMMDKDEHYTGGEGIASRDEAKANARLMAAAPALLDALRPLAAFYDVLTESDLQNDQEYGNVCIYARGNIEGEVALNVADIVAAHTLVEKAEKG